jgi:uridine kinase
MNDLPLEERAKQDYDAPHAIDVQLLESHIRDYAAGRAIEIPICDFAKHLRVSNRREHIPATSLLIVEGILALHFAQLRQHFDLSIYLEAPDSVCFHRRKVRDITERQRSLEFIQSQYEDKVLPAARQYVLPSKRFANLVLDSAADLATVEKSLYDTIVEKHAPARRYRGGPATPPANQVVTGALKERHLASPPAPSKNVALRATRGENPEPKSQKQSRQSLIHRLRQDGHLL